MDMRVHLDSSISSGNVAVKGPLYEKNLKIKSKSV